MKNEIPTCGECGHPIHTGEHSSQCLHAQKKEKESIEESIHLLELKEQKETEQINTRVALEVIRRVEEAFRSIDIDTFYEQDSRQKALEFSKALKELWPENNGRRMPMFELGAINPTFQNVIIDFRHRTKNADKIASAFRLGEIRIRIGIQQLMENGPEKINEDLQRIGIYIFHELEHLISEGDSDTSEGTDKTQYYEYLSNPGEMRANAKGFAYRYVRNFPGEKFDTVKNNTLLTEDRHDREYYTIMSEGDQKQQEVSRSMYEMTSWYVDHISKIIDEKE